MSYSRARRRPFAVTLFYFIWRCVRITLVASLGAFGPPPPRAPPRVDPIEQREEGASLREDA